MRAYRWTFRSNAARAPATGDRPIVPAMTSADYVSSRLGIVALERPYVNLHSGPGTWSPVLLERCALIRFDRP